LKILGRFPGVPMFFVMSGFLISASLERNASLKNYFKNRALRIYPGLWLCIILTVVVISVVGNINFFNVELPKWLLTQMIGIIYTPTFLNHYGFGSYNGSLWTIPIEIQFYIVLPIIYFLIQLISKKEVNKTIFIFFTFLFFTVSTYFVLKYFSNPDLATETRAQKLLRYSFIPHVYLFLFGVVLQRLKAYNWNIIFGKGFLWVAVYLLISYISPESYEMKIVSNLILAITAISIAYTYPGVANKILHGNDISYGVYIYHGLVIGVFVELGFLRNPSYVFVIFITTYLLAYFSWILIEKPSIRRKKKTIHDVSKIESN